MPSALMLWPDQPGLSLLVAIAVLVLVMFGARTAAHRVIQGIAKAIADGCKLLSKAINGVQKRLAERNREVLMAAGMEDSERQIEQEFKRISDAVERDLGAYPALHKQLADQVNSIDEDYRRSSDSPPVPESWAQTLKAAGELADRAGNQGGAAGKAVNALRQSVEEAHDEAMKQYRSDSKERHKLLSKMLPMWRNMDSSLSRVEVAVTNIFERSRRLDDLMSEYRDIASRSDAAERKLAASALTQFLIAGFVLMVAVGGGFINFQLIALPMSEMVGATSRVGSMQTSDIAALVIILVEITMGLFLMESLRITRLFPVIGRLERRTRIKMAWATFSILLILAGIESSLAYMRDMLAADRAALTATLAGVASQRPEFMWIPAVGQMIMGFILPFALTFVAIPLESFVDAGRAVGGQVAVGALKTLAFSVDMVGFAAGHVATGLKNMYDIVVFLPLKLAELIKPSGTKKKKKEKVSVSKATQTEATTV